MIPKKIHYCWFGKNPLPKFAKKCIKSWKKYCKDYEIIEWNEDNFDISSAPLYVRQAYEAKKWAFVTDYVRLKVVYENGGIYLDTDVELIKNIDFLLDNRAYFGFETKEYIATGLGFGAEKHCGILKEMMEDYDDIPFLLEDGSFDSTPCPVRNTEVFKKYNLKQDGSLQNINGCLLLPRDYLNPLSYAKVEKNITENTVSIHWFSGSWLPPEQQNQMEEFKQALKKKRRLERKDKLIHLPNRALKRILGEERYQKLKAKIKRHE